MNPIRNKANILMALLLVMVFAGNGRAESLYEMYTKKPVEELKAETEEMSEQIVSKFSQQSMDINRQKINFYDYFSNFKKLLLYGSKLSTYSDYEEDLKFAKENELFKGLPDKETQTDKSQRGQFVKEKYQMMQANIKDEIQTYVELIQGSLDACEHLALYDLDDIGMSDRNRDGVRYYLETSKASEMFFEKRGRLAKKWPALEMRIGKQLEIWTEKGLAPADAIIDRKITEVISNDNRV